MSVTLRWVTPDPGDAAYQAERALRWRVLRAPLGRPPGSEENAHEARCLHLVALDAADAVVGCVIFREDPGATGQLMQMAVEPTHERRGIGRLLVRELEREVAVRGVREVTLHAREVAVGFYARLGYEPFGAPFTEVGIPHREMRRRLEPAGA